MQVVVATHDSTQRHDTGSWHPERSQRVEAVLAGIGDSNLDPVRLEAPMVERTDLLRVHDSNLIEAIESMSVRGGGMIDPDTFVSSGSWEAALRSAGAVFGLVDALSEDQFGFAVTRPPGHHATRDQAMGFCLFNNVAVTAQHLRDRGDRVAILDWDVHHGNGTQEILGADPGVLYVSVHQSNFYPHEGYPADIRLPASGTNLNLAVPQGTGGDVFRVAWGEVLLPTVSKFGPDWILVSCGFDAHRDDPIGELNLTESDFGWVASRLGEAIGPSRLIFALEGGYHLEALRASSKAVVDGVAGQQHWEDPQVSASSSWEALEAFQDLISEYWG